MEELTLESKIKELEQAKKNVKEMLERDCTINMHGIEYWAGRVERLRNLIKNSL